MMNSQAEESTASKYLHLPPVPVTKSSRDMYLKCFYLCKLVE